jgi:hypothetical protein
MVDDTLIWSDNLETAFYQTCDYFDTCARNGIILNPKKFHFVKEAVEFAGIKITMDSVKPSEKHLQAI